MIRSLSKEVQSLLRSGVAVFSLQQCVEELLLNSIDAGATCVAVKIDIEACRVQVIDNGSGVDRENMERVGIRYCTSKCSSVDDLDNLCFYGFRGEAIASMVAMATVVEITSRTKTSVKTFVKRFHEGKASDVFEAQTTRPAAGTTVLICNFFHNMPVRRKRMDSVLEVERVRQRVEAISLMHASVSFTVKRDCSGTLLVQLPKARNTYYRFVQIHGLNRAQKLGEVNYTFGQFEMAGHVGREGHYNSSLQFLFVNGRLLLKTRLHKLLNCLLRRLSSVQASNPDVSAVVSSPKQKGSGDLHGVYIINIKCPYSEYDVCLEPAKSLIEFKDWDSVLLCIEEGIKGFLTKENLVSECSVSDIQNFRNKENSPGGNVNIEDTGRLAAPENTDIAQDDDMPESNMNSDSESEKEVADNEALDTALQKTLGNDPDTQCADRNDRTSPLCVSSDEIARGENSRIAVIDHKVAYDSLRRFGESNLSCAPKRKLIPLHAQSHTEGRDCGPKIGRVTQCRKLMLSFETGSLDKFKRMFGKEVEMKPQTPNAKIPDVLCQSDTFDSSALDARNNLVCPESMPVEDGGIDCSLFMDSSVFKKVHCSSGSKRTRISLASKLSRKVEHEDAKNTLISVTPPNPVTQDTASIEKLPSSLPVQVNDNGFSNHTIIAESSVTTEPEDDDRPDEPTFSAPNGQEMSTSTTTTTTTEDAELTKKTASPKPDNPPGQIVDPASQHDLSTSKTGNEDQTPNESQSCESDGAKPVSSDWLTHYDDSLGKLVYVNQVTGLSKYENPLLKETQVPCSTNLTNMAVSVVTRTGRKRSAHGLSS